MIKNLFLATVSALAAVECSAAPVPDKLLFWTRQIGDCEFTARTNCPNALAKVGDTISITISVKSPKKGYFAVDAYQDGIQQGETRYFEFGRSAELSFTAERPGSVAVVCPLLNAKKRQLLLANRRKAVGYFGVVIAPEAIEPGNPIPPADFDDFWTRMRAELDKVPIKATRNEVPLAPLNAKKYPNVVCYDVKVDSAGGIPVTGYLCMPRDAKPKSLPAIVVFPGAGVRSAKMNPEYGKTAIALDFNAHGIENGNSPEHYRQLYRKPPPQRLPTRRLGRSPQDLLHVDDRPRHARAGLCEEPARMERQDAGRHRFQPRRVAGAGGGGTGPAGLTLCRQGAVALRPRRGSRETPSRRTAALVPGRKTARPRLDP
ncbi:MAG: acetylxylan esterase [Lentisphaeria bacterium]|nr:acetylxylan esterase [Lentisphaeria bacterium]